MRNLKRHDDDKELVVSILLCDGDYYWVYGKDENRYDFEGEGKG